MSSINVDDFLENCQTGDILLYSTTKWYSKLIEYFTGSKFSHIGIILRDPVFLNEKLKGLYVFESGSEGRPDSEDGKMKYGVQITDLKAVLSHYSKNGNGTLYYRRCHCSRDEEFEQKLKKVHDVTYDKPYDFDVIDWIKAEFDIEIGNENKTSTFWCSALAAYTYYQLGFIKGEIKWTIVSPKEFSYYEDNKAIHFQNCTLDPELKVVY